MPMDKSPDAFRTISEVSELLETPAHVLRFWESRFPQIKPVKRAGGRRYYRPVDLALLFGIRRLLHDEGLTIRGVQKILREQGVRHVSGLSAEDEAGFATDAQDDGLIEDKVVSAEPIALFPSPAPRAEPPAAPPQGSEEAQPSPPPEADAPPAAEAEDPSEKDAADELPAPQSQPQDGPFAPALADSSALAFAGFGMPSPGDATGFGLEAQPDEDEADTEQLVGNAPAPAAADWPAKAEGEDDSSALPSDGPFGDTPEQVAESADATDESPTPRDVSDGTGPIDPPWENATAPDPAPESVPENTGTWRDAAQPDNPPEEITGADSADDAKVALTSRQDAINHGAEDHGDVSLSDVEQPQIPPKSPEAFLPEAAQNTPPLAAPILPTSRLPSPDTPAPDLPAAPMLDLSGHWLPADLRALRKGAFGGKTAAAAALARKLEALRNRVGDRGRVPRR
jgi:DNA-binding transcriptional MerR regulator